MLPERVVLFGYNEYALEIAAQVNEVYERLVVYCLNDDEAVRAKEAGYETYQTDLDDDWEMMTSYDVDVTRFVCALDDEAENLFLTISLRDTMPDALIVALASTQEHAGKLTLAGADKVITSLLTTSNLLIELLEKPVISELFNEIMEVDQGLEIAQIEVGGHSDFVGKNLYDIPFSAYDVMALAVVDYQMSTTFIFTAKGYNHCLDPGDLLVVIGYDEAIDTFRKAVNVKDAS